MFAPPMLELLSGIFQVRVYLLNIDPAIQHGMKLSAPLDPLAPDI